MTTSSIQIYNTKSIIKTNPYSKIVYELFLLNYFKQLNPGLKKGRLDFFIN